MAHIIIPDNLIDTLRPLYETAWEKELREKEKRLVSANEVIFRIVTQAFEAAKKRRAI
jgi:hypothetical protein